MEIGDSYDGFVDNGKWNYWTFHYFTSSPLRVTVNYQITAFGSPF